MKRRVGCVLVREKRVIITCYNGTPRGMKNCSEGVCSRCNDGNSSGAALSTCLCLHAEENALLEAGRERIREGSTLYCDTCPCLTCSIKIAQVGVSEVVYSQGYSMDTDTAAVFKQAGVRLRQFIPVRTLLSAFYCYSADLVIARQWVNTFGKAVLVLIIEPNKIPDNSQFYNCSVLIEFIIILFKYPYFFSTLSCCNPNSL